MSRQRQKRRRIRFEGLETRMVLDAAGLACGADPVAPNTSTETALFDSLKSTSRSEGEAASVANAIVQSAGTLTLDAIILGVQNDLQISLGELELVTTELSGTIDIGTAFGDGTNISGFTISGGLVTASDASNFVNLSGVSAEPLEINLGTNPVVGGNFDASEVGLSINNGIAEIPTLGLSFNFSTDPVEGPGSGTGTIFVNSVSGRDYDVTVSIPIALQLEAAPGVIASVNGNIVASGIITVAAQPSEIISDFYHQLKDSVGSDKMFGDLIVAAKSAIDSGDENLLSQVYIDAYALTAESIADVVGAYEEIATGVVDPDERDYLYFSLLTVIAEFESLRDFLVGAVQSPVEFETLTAEEFFDAAVLKVQQDVFHFEELN